MSRVTTVEDRVRARVRDRGIDPLREPAAVRSLVDEVLAELVIDERVDDGAEDAATAAFHAIAGFGPLQPYLDDPEVEELWINAPGRVFVARGGRSRDDAWT